MKRFFVVFLVVLFSFPGFASADIPEPPAADVATWVFDHAEMLGSRTEGMLDAYIRDLAWLCDAQVVIVTMDSLDGADIDDYGYDLFNGWGLSSRDVLILLAPQGGIGIYLGTEAGLAFSDDHCLVLIDDLFMPYYADDVETAMLELTRHTCLFYAYKASALFSDPDALVTVAGFDRKAVDLQSE